MGLREGCGYEVGRGGDDVMMFSSLKLFTY